MQDDCKNYLERIKQQQSKTVQRINLHLNKNKLTNLDIACRECKDEMKGSRAFFSSDSKTSYDIILCQDRIRNERELIEAFVHELTHAYDSTINNLDLSKCKDLACSEIRAAMNAECLNSWKFIPFLNIRENLKEKCVKHSAINATNMIFKNNGDANKCVKESWEECFTKA